MIHQLASCQAVQSAWTRDKHAFKPLELFGVMFGRYSLYFVYFWATVYKTVRPMLSDRCLPCPVCPVCDVGVLWPKGWTDQDET